MEEHNMKFKEISMLDQPIFDKFEYISSDYVFSYLFMYSDLYKLSCFDDDRSVIIRSDAGYPCFYMPLGDVEWGTQKVLEYCRANGIKPVFTKIPESFLDIFRDLKFTIQDDRDSYDYIFRNSDLALFKGKGFRKQRNNMVGFVNLYCPKYTRDIAAHTEACREFTLENYSQPEIVNPTIKLLANISRFNCEGGVVWSKEKVQAFCIYEKVSKDTLLCHVELTGNSHRGIHAYMINEMAKGMNEEYINKEDDVGSPGLRRFKESHNPCFFLKKYSAYME
jgi:hypothetical protein